MQKNTPIVALAKDLNLDPERVAKWAKAERLPVRLPAAMREAIANAKAATIRAAAGAVCCLILAAPAMASTHERLLVAIQAVETGGHPDPANAVGDGGKARGWFQMWEAFHTDARQQDGTLKPYRACCADLQDSRKAVRAYWKKYKCKTDRVRALVFHYGPSARLKGYVDRHGYWAKVKKRL